MVKSPSGDASDAFTHVCHLQRAAANSDFELSERKFSGKMSCFRRCSDSSLTNKTLSLKSEGARLKSRTSEVEALLNNGRILFTFIARLPAPLKRVSARSQSLAAASRPSFSVELFKSCCTSTSTDHSICATHAAPYLVSCRDAAQPNPGLIHSLAAPGGLLAPSCPLFLLSCHQITSQLL